jgi:hypothetical protein
MRHLSAPIPPPFGHVEHHRPSRERSSLTREDLDTATVIRRAGCQLGRDLAVSVGAQRWEEVDEETRELMRDAMVSQLTKRLGDARMQLRLHACIGPVPLPAVERVARLERALDAARRLP